MTQGIIEQYQNGEHACAQYSRGRTEKKIFVTLEKQTFHQKYDPIKAKKKNC